MSKKISINKRLRKQEGLYLDSIKSTGGYVEEFREWVRSDCKKHPDEYAHYYDDLLDTAVTTIWGETPKPMPLFRIAGMALPEKLTYVDKSKPGGFGTVLSKHANTGQLREAAILVMRKGAEAVRKGEDLMSVADVALDRAGADIFRPLNDLLDD